MRAAAADGMTILLCSAGRRPYLVRWFQQALACNGVHGRVIVADADPYAAAGAVADAFVRCPRIAEPGYEEWLRGALLRFDVDLALSFNDFELSTWSEMESTPPALLTLGSEQQRLVEDKWAMATAATAAGIAAPPTWIAAEVLDGADLERGGGTRFVVKSRFGSGSVGLRFADLDDVRLAIESASATVLNRRGEPVGRGAEAAEQLVVQEHVEGTEFGVDVLADFDRNYAGSLARRKLGMRDGETEKAATVDPRPFAGIGSALCGLTRHRGLIDTDVIVDDRGRPWLIDVNPRFGGGYPFSHLGGANAPAAVVGWALGRAVDTSWIRADPQIVSSKSVDVVRLGAVRAAP